MPTSAPTKRTSQSPLSGEAFCARLLLVFSLYNRGGFCYNVEDYDIIHKSGSWFSYEDAKICQGRNNLLTLLEDNLEFLEEVEKQIKDRIMEKENPDLDKLIENIEN